VLPLGRTAIALLILFAQAAQQPSEVPGYGPWRLGMSRAEVEAVRELGPYKPVSATGGLETPNGSFMGRTTNISFVFGEHGLRRIQIWAYEGRDENEAVAAFLRVYRNLESTAGCIRAAGVAIPEGADDDAFVKAVKATIDTAPPNRMLKFQLGPETRSPTVGAFSSFFRQPQLGVYYVFLYYQEPTPVSVPQAPAGAAASSDAGPFRVGGDVAAPVLIDSVRPEYPEEARKSKISGRVVFRAVISEYGKVESLELVESDHPLLTKAARDSIRQWRYRPATKDGRPVRVFLTVSTAFNVH